MMYNIKASALTLIVGIALAIVSLSMPWMVANHYVDVGGKKEVADNYVFYLWGQRYTVIGTKLIQSVTDLYDYRDFPFYSMAAVVIAIALGAFTFLANRGTIINIRGKVIKLKATFNPIIPLAIASMLLLFAWWYVQDSSLIVVEGLKLKAYVIEQGPSLDFLILSFIAYLVTIVTTGLKTIKKPAEKVEQTKSTSSSNAKIT